MEAQPELEDLGGYADRVKVLRDLEHFASTLNSTYTNLNTTTKALYSRSVEHHHQQLFDTLFPYIRKSKTVPRTLEQLRARYTVPRGIIIPCGNDQFVYAVHLIATLKHVHRTILPIHVVHAGGDDLVPEKRAALRSIHPDVETVDILNFFDEEVVGIHGGGWAIKVFAILASPFQEVIIADADAVFMQDPEVMYSDPGYNRTGTLYFRDREIFPGDGNVHQWWRKQMEGREPSLTMQQSRWWTDQASREEMESGVIVFDKTRKDVVLGLVFAGYLNTRGVREPVTYANTYGDKESFWMAFELCGIPYHMDKEYAAIIGQLTHPDTKSHSIDSFIQSDHLFHLDHSMLDSLSSTLLLTRRDLTILATVAEGKPLWWNGSLFMVRLPLSLPLPCSLRSRPSSPLDAPQEKRVKDRGYLIATHWAPGSVDWECDYEPWRMRTTQRDVVDLQTDKEFTRTLSAMIGAAVWWEGRL
ncbi:SPOSA6832_00239, partial [Sporobolomyces salmonicolor]